MPERNTPEYFAMGLLDQILVQGDNSLLVQKLENEKGFSSDVNGGINYLGNMFNYKGPMLWMYDLTYDTETSREEILVAIDEVMSGLKLTLNYYFYGDRWSYFNGGNVEMSDINDLNLGAVYRITDAFSVNLKAGNLLGRKYDNWYGYPAQGLNAMGGFTFKF